VFMSIRTETSQKSIDSPTGILYLPAIATPLAFLSNISALGFTSFLAAPTCGKTRNSEQPVFRRFLATNDANAKSKDKPAHVVPFANARVRAALGISDTKLVFMFAFACTALAFASVPAPVDRVGGQ